MAGGILAGILARFQPVERQPPVGVPQAKPAGASLWDAARAAEVQAAIHARLDQAAAAIPANHPRRASRLAILAGDRRIVAGLVESKDPALWDWLAGLEALLDRWREWDRQ